MWQVGDTYQQNGRFKISLVEMKKKLMDLRQRTFCSELELVPTDIMAMINYAWSNSFGDLQGNCEAIASTGWNPLTKVLLLHPALRRTMSDHDRQVELELGLVTEKKLELLLDEMESYDVDDGNDQLNFNNGYAGVMINKIVGYSDIKKARARNNEKAIFGTNTKALKLTLAGELVKVANTHEFGVDLLSEMRRRKEDMEQIAIAKEMKRKKKRVNVINKYKKLVAVKRDEQTWTISDFKVAIKALKRDSDRSIPGKKQELVLMCNKIKGRKDSVMFELENLVRELDIEDM